MDNRLSSTSELNSLLPLGGELPLAAIDAGMMISRGHGRHVSRTASYYVLLFIREGTLHIEEEGRTFAVEAGQSLILWPYRHHFGTQDFGPDLQYYWLHFTLPDAEVGQPKIHIPQITTVARPEFVTELFRRYLDDAETGRVQPLNAALYAWMILTEIADNRAPADTRAATVLAGRAYTYIRTHYHEKLSASDVAKAVGYNPQYLSRVFQQTYKHSLTFAIQRTRINHAKMLLIHTNYNVSEVAKLSGFDDAAYFQRVFKQLEDTTPLRFQRLRARLKVNS